MEARTSGESSSSQHHRLDFGAVQHWRSELQTLLAHARNESVEEERPASVWIEAEPGVGKSILLQQFRDDITRDDPDDATSSSCICIQGKFEERAAASEPFAALSDAMQELVEQVLSMPSVVDGISWRYSIGQALDTELPLLLDILPVLRSAVESKEEVEEEEEKRSEDDNDEEEYAFGDFNAKEWRFERFRLAFRALIRHVCHRLRQRKASLILILDDFHWVDPDSLQIIKTLLEDVRRPSNFFLVVATRPIDGYEALIKLKMALLEREEKMANSDSAIPVGKLLDIIRITSLPVSEIKDILIKLLGFQEEKEPLQTEVQDIEELATIVKGKTQGNFFVVIQFLRLLERSGHFVYKDQKWTFDNARISDAESISENVSEVVAHNLEGVDGRRRSALMVAASFGVSQFDVSTVVHAMTVLEESNDEAEDEDDCMGDSMYEDPYVVAQKMNDMSCELNEAAFEGFVEETSPGHYRFVHDRIRESAYSLLPPGNSRKEVHLRVGRQLRGWMDTSSELGLSQGKGLSKESLLLHAAKQSNMGADLIQDEWELLDLAELNYQAAELAARKAAFFSSMEYLQVGLSHLGEDAWERHYALTFKFSIALARMQYCLGLLDECWETAGAVIEHGKTFKDKSRMYHTRILCLMQREKTDEALNLALEAFELMEKPFPRRYLMFHAAADFMKIRRFLKKTSDEEILALPTADDEDTEIYLDFLEQFVELIWFSNNFGYLLLYAFRSVGMIANGRKYLRCYIGLALWAVIKIQLGDFGAGCRVADLCASLGEEHRAKFAPLIARLDVANACFLWTWREQFRANLPFVKSAFRTFWVHGLINYALVDGSALLQHLFVCGEPLVQVAGESDKYSEACVDYKQMMCWYINAPLYQAVLNLQGKSSEPALLVGDHIVNACAFQEACKESANTRALFQYQYWSALVAYHFGEYHRAKRYIKAMRSDLFEDGPDVLVTLRLLYTGLVYYKLYKEMGKGKYRRRALTAYRQLKKWSKKGVVCCNSMCRLLEAEELSTRGRSSSNIDAIIMSYNRAIESAVEAGLKHHHALAQELSGAFLHSQKSSLAGEYISRALHLYEEWGAMAKVEDIQSRYAPHTKDKSSVAATRKDGLKRSEAKEQERTETETFHMESSSMMNSNWSSVVLASSYRGL